MYLSCLPALITKQPYLAQSLRYPKKTYSERLLALMKMLTAKGMVDLGSSRFFLEAKLITLTE